MNIFEKESHSMTPDVIFFGCGGTMDVCELPTALLSDAIDETGHPGDGERRHFRDSPRN